MVQVHTVYSASRWQNTVDGLRQECTPASRAVAVAEGRRVALELGGRHFVHDVDGRVTETANFEDSKDRDTHRLDPIEYIS